MNSDSPQPVIAAAKPLWRPGENPAVDLVMFRQRSPEAPIEICVVRRGTGPNVPACPGMRSNPGGFVNSLTGRGEPFVAAETPLQAALRELQEETGLERDDLASMVKQTGYYDSVERDPRSSAESYVSSTAFSVFLTGEWGSDTRPGLDEEGLVEVSDVEWIPLDALFDETLAFDHGRVIEDAARAMGIALPGPLRSWVDEREPATPAPSRPKP